MKKTIITVFNKVDMVSIKWCSEMKLEFYLGFCWDVAAKWFLADESDLLLPQCAMQTGDARSGRHSPARDGHTYGCERVSHSSVESF